MIIRFDSIFNYCVRTDEMNNFLWATMLYFDAFLDHKEASSDENVRVPG